MYVLMLDVHIPMYRETLTELDVNQTNLIFWSKYYYQSVFSKPQAERPDEFTINYDILLDDWLDRQEFKERTQKSSSNDSQHIIEFG